MCLSPQLIRNPNLGLGHIGLNYMKDCSSLYLRVPCGHCPECIAVRQMGIVQRMNLEYKFNHIFFCMLSYRPVALPVHVTSDGWKLPYAEWKDLQDMMKRLRKRNAFGRPFRYLAVSEFGGLNHRPHFHVLFIVRKHDIDSWMDIRNLESLMFREVLSEWKRNVAVRIRKKDGALVPDNVHPKYIKLLDYRRTVTRLGVKSNYTLEHVRPLSLFSNEDAVSFYISKYVTKFDHWTEKLRSAIELNLEEDEAKTVWNIVKPRCKWSRGFGLNGSIEDVLDNFTGEVRKMMVPDKKAIEYVHQIVSKSVSNGSPQFLAENGAVYPLSRYYYRFGDIIDPSLADRFFMSSGRDDTEGVVYFDKQPGEIEVSKQKFEKNKRLIKSNCKL